MGNAAGGMEGAAARENRDPRAPGPAAAAAATPPRPPPPARQPMPSADELEERFSRVLVSPGEAAVLAGLCSVFFLFFFFPSFPIPAAWAVSSRCSRELPAGCPDLRAARSGDANRLIGPGDALQPQGWG